MFKVSREHAQPYHYFVKDVKYYENTVSVRSIIFI